MTRLALFCLALVSLPSTAAECHSVDPAAGSVSFELKQAGAAFRGAFRRFGGEICLADGRVTHVEVWLDPASADTGLPEIDAALKNKEFFAVRDHPRIAFASLSVETRGDGQRARGTLEIKGKRREMEVPFRLAVGSGRPTVSGSLVLNRLDYDIGTGEWSNTEWLGAQVKVDFEATLSAR
ncbi:MAG TPA: YceI family protein [Burkholderiales bacterium]|nr:YceI family protein [Burkholderiales bacterium]